MVATEKIFIVGCNRTGTSLLREILNRSDRICIATETHFLRRLSRIGQGKRLKKFGDLSSDDNVHRLVAFMYARRDACSSAYWKWLAKNVDRSAFTRQLLESDRSERSIFTTLMRVYAEHRKGVAEGLILGEKTPTHYYYVPTLLEWFPQAKIIHTFRDPRAITVSTIKKIKKKGNGSLLAKLPFLPARLLMPLIAPAETLHISRAWLDAARMHTQYERAYSERYYLLRFEDFIREPEQSIRRVCQFLDMAYQPDMLAEMVNLNSSYQPGRRALSGIDAGAADRWQGYIHPLIKVWFSARGRKELERFGYAP